MNAPPSRDAGSDAWQDALHALALFAIDPVGTGGIALRAQAGPVRDRWLALLRQSLPDSAPLRKMPVNIADGRLLGGLDLGATLLAGRPVAERGLLAEADGGVILIAMAERLSPGTAARLAATLDAGEQATERDGVAFRSPARIGLVALDESASDEERLAPAIADRLAFPVDVTAIAWGDAQTSTLDPTRIITARALVGRVTVPDAMLEVLCTTADALGISSLRAPLLAMGATRAAAALAGRVEAAAEDAAMAARLVLAPRATRIPADPDSPPPPAPNDPPESQEHDGGPGEDKPNQGEETGSGELGEIVLEAARAAIPAGLLRLIQSQGHAAHSTQQGKQGAAQKGLSRGRPVGVRPADPGPGLRLDLIETLRAASPWQRLRKTGQDQRVALRREDFRVTRCEQRSRTVTIFVVDASGSSALNRLAEAKGAVELLLADCYQRRDQVAVLAFRGRAAQLLLPPTRSLVRAKRSLSTLPGGGGTPLAAGIEAGFLLAATLRRNGLTPTIVLLTDGRANVARDGSGGRTQAGKDAITAARLLRAPRIGALLVDTSPRPAQEARLLAAEMGALYLPLPYADAASLSRSVRAVTQAGRA